MSKAGRRELPKGRSPKLLRILTALDRSTGQEGVDIPGFRRG